MPRQTHHDQNSHPHSVIGVRLFTFFIYLKDPESGGETYFPKLRITVCGPSPCSMVRTFPVALQGAVRPSCSPNACANALTQPSNP